jgi:hypothetical protein
MEQWGFNSRLGSAIQVVTFPIPFPNNVVYNVIASRRNASGNEVGQAPAVVGTPGGTSFQIAHADNSIGAYWRALGR